MGEIDGELEHGIERFRRELEDWSYHLSKYGPTNATPLHLGSLRSKVDILTADFGELEVLMCSWIEEMKAREKDLEEQENELEESEDLEEEEDDADDEAD